MDAQRLVGRFLRVKEDGVDCNTDAVHCRHHAGLRAVIVERHRLVLQVEAGESVPEAYETSMKSRHNALLGRDVLQSRKIPTETAVTVKLPSRAFSTR